MEYFLNTDFSMSFDKEMNDVADKFYEDILKEYHTKKMKHVFGEINGLVYLVVFSALPQGGIGYRQLIEKYDSKIFIKKVSIKQLIS